MSFFIGLGLGFVAGWLFVKRPQWVTDGLEYLKSKLGW